MYNPAGFLSSVSREQDGCKTRSEMDIHNHYCSQVVDPSEERQIAVTLAYARKLNTSTEIKVCSPQN